MPDIRRDSVVNGARVNIGSAGADPRESLMVRFSGLPGSKSMARIERSVEELERPIWFFYDGIISCVLANIYLHYVLDSWFEKQFKTTCNGDAYLHRYADDTVAVFQYHDDAVRYFEAVQERLRMFGLNIAPEKSFIKVFSRFRKRECERFDFLGFEYRWGKTRNGVDAIKLRTSRKKLRKSLSEFREWMREHRNKRLRWLFDKVTSKLLGYYNYYGVMGNSPSLKTVRKEVINMICYWLNRRSQRKSYNRQQFRQMFEYYTLPWPKVVWQLWSGQQELDFA